MTKLLLTILISAFTFKNLHSDSMLAYKDKLIGKWHVINSNDADLGIYEFKNDGILQMQNAEFKYGISEFGLSLVLDNYITPANRIYPNGEKIEIVDNNFYVLNLTKVTPEEEIKIKEKFDNAFKKIFRNNLSSETQEAVFEIKESTEVEKLEQLGLAETLLFNLKNQELKINNSQNKWKFYLGLEKDIISVFIVNMTNSNVFKLIYDEKNEEFTLKLNILNKSEGTLPTFTFFKINKMQ